MRQRVVFACSGSAEDCAAIRSLVARRDADVVALTLDIGQGRQLETVRQAALEAGAVRVHVLDVRDEFARDCIRGSLRWPSSGRVTHQPLSRALIGRTLVETARVEAATVIAHGGDAEDHAAILAAAGAIDPAIRVVAVQGVAASAHTRSIRATLWGRTLERGATLVVPPARVLDRPAQLEISFEGGLPVAVNGVPMTPAELVESVTTIAGHHGVGRLVDDVTGAPCEAPAAVVLLAAHEALGDDALDAPGATVRLELFQGHHRIVSAHHS